jgi:hypothetical protein
MAVARAHERLGDLIAHRTAVASAGQRKPSHAVDVRALGTPGAGDRTLPTSMLNRRRATKTHSQLFPRGSSVSPDAAHALASDALRAPRLGLRQTLTHARAGASQQS